MEWMRARRFSRLDIRTLLSLLGWFLFQGPSSTQPDTPVWAQHILARLNMIIDTRLAFLKTSTMLTNISLSLDFPLPIQCSCDEKKKDKGDPSKQKENSIRGNRRGTQRQNVGNESAFCVNVIVLRFYVLWSPLWQKVNRFFITNFLYHKHNISVDGINQSRKTMDT